ncbi:Serpin B3 [Nosema granulosis]|uniref:Serpin B3 n=1 Tax=Nosema granulosis TaxID=83296 RepID=A0A9P6KZK6_9MICR|nr:Serpin B3 [Nosema granulosis]
MLRLSQKERINFYLKNQDSTKKKIFDIEITENFLKNTTKTSLFSPFCSEMNLYLQACTGEYGFDHIKQKSTEYIEELFDVLDIKEENKTNINSEEDNEIVKSLAANSILIPSVDENFFPENSSAYFWEKYNSTTKEKILSKHKTWEEKKTKKTLTSSIEEYDLSGKRRIYTSTFYFRDRWDRYFNSKDTKKARFTTRPNGYFYDRLFMFSRYYYKYDCGSLVNSKFRVVAIPYTTKFLFTIHQRYMVYIIPSDLNQDLSLLWKDFITYTKFNIDKYIFTLKLQLIDLYVPKIENFEETLDLKDIFKSTHREGLDKSIKPIIKIRMAVNESGTEAVSEVVTNSFDTDSEITVKANRSHIAFIYDMKISRILFVFNDVGEEAPIKTTAISLSSKKIKVC